MNPQPVAYVLDREKAERVINGECLERSSLERLIRAANPYTETVIILAEDSLDDPQAIANAIVDGLGVVPEARTIDDDEPVPEGFAHHHFVEIGDDPLRTTRAQVIVEIIPPIKFC